MSANVRLSIREKAGYALGDAACNLYWKTFEFFLLFYYTDVFGLSPGAAGTMFAVARIIDGVCDPIMGVIADRTQTRWGKYRPFLLWFAVPNAVAGILTFTSPPLAGEARLVYAYLTYTLMMMSFTAINIPYSALMGVITADQEDRTQLSAYRFAGALSAGLAVVFFTKPLVRRWGETDAAHGWQSTMVVWGLAAVVMFALCFLATRERIHLSDTKSNLRQELRGVFQNGPLLVLLILSVIIMTTFWIRSATALYYFKYAVHREDLFELVAVGSTVAMLAGIPLTGAVRRWCGGKRTAYMVVMGVSSGLVLLFYVVPPDSLAIIVGLNLLISFVLGPQSPLLFAMYADTIDYAEWHTGRRSSGLVFATATFALKVGGAFAGWITGLLLAAFGYAANHAQSVESLHGILLLMSIVPGGIGLLAVVTLLGYRLDDERVRRIGEELAARRAAGGAA